MSESELQRLAVAARRHAGSIVVERGFRGLARLGALFPQARPASHGVSVERDVRYAASGLALDIYRPVAAAGPTPALLYLHGGGFRILSKETHWVMGLAFARAGYTVFNADYRLAPQHPYPAAVEDACEALLWVHANARAHGADPERLVVAGESAGANLAAVVALATSYRRSEGFARAVFDANVRARAVIAQCGLFQVSEPTRLWRERAVPTFIADRLVEIEHDYLGGRAGFDLADPLVWLERAEAPARPLTPFFASVGSRDIVADDSRRLEAALHRLGATCERRVYDGEAHAFQAFVWRANARRAWRDAFAFLDAHVPRA